jgi:hypothetical protein
VKTGHCLCGDIRYEFRGPHRWAGHCHCESCRRNTSSAFTTWFGVPKAAHRFTGAAPAIYQSSPGVKRYFCATCGTPMAFESHRWPDEIHLYAASLTDSRDFAPKFHVHVAEKVPWIEIGDDLPQYPHNAS